MEGTTTLVDVENVYFNFDTVSAKINDVAGDYGTAGDDALLEGTNGANHLYGLSGDDVLAGYEGDDLIDGGDGYDQVQFSGAAADYTFALNSDGSVTVTDNVGTDGSDVLIDLESAYFQGDSTTSSIEGLTNPAPLTRTSVTDDYGYSSHSMIAPHILLEVQHVADFYLA